MDKNLKNFLLQMDYTENEVESMKNIAPMLDVTTLNEVKEVIKILQVYGFPKEDLPELFIQNPNIMTMDKNTLSKELDNLLIKNIDIEEYLKNNPFGI